MAEKEGNDMISRYAPTQSASPLFTQAYQNGAAIPMNHTAAEIQSALSPIGGKRTLSYAYGKAARDIDVISNEISSGQPLSPERWQFLHTRLGQTIGDMENGDKKGIDQAKKLYKAMYDDLDTLAQVGGPGASALKQAKTTYLREKSVSDIQGYITDAMKTLRGQGGDKQFSSAEVIRKLKDDQFYEKAFTAAERKDIEKTLNILNTAPTLPAPGSVNTGGKRMYQRFAGAGAGAAAGAYIGNTLGEPAAGAALGAVAGFGARDLADTASNIAFAMKTDTGRAMIRELAKNNSFWKNMPRNAAVLSAYAAALRNQPDTEMTRE
jgi:hypothetical protein